jgi:hypothetical protein
MLPESRGISHELMSRGTRYTSHYVNSIKLINYTLKNDSYYKSSLRY